MKTKAHLLLIAIILASTCRCIAEDEKFTKITSLTNRLEILGVSMLPPQENGWRYQKKHPGRIEFGKIGKNNSQSFLGLVVLSKLPDIGSKEEFLEVISKQRGRDSGNSRFECLINTEVFSGEKNTPSVRFHTKIKDIGSKYLPKGSSHLIVEDFGIICRHPEDRNIAVTIALSQRSLPDDAVENFKSVADEFIKNAQFIPFPP